ncbi:MAG: hypothetical protein PHR15_05565 [Atopobiaceae bacterium]|nr:hypothetical protein [Atopobiaceae bacterium]
MYKHELCMGPMSCNDVNQNDVQEMLDRLRSMRGSFRLYKSGWAQFCASLRMKEYSVDNQTRFPRAALAGCGWVEECMSKDIYPPSNMKCLRITDEGRKALSGISELKDLRLEEFNQCTGDVQDSLIRLGFYQLLGRSGYDLSIVQESLDRDADIAKDVTGGKELLFSPFQVLSCSRVNRALDIDTTGYRDAAAENKVQLSDRSPRATTMLLKANDDSSCKFSDGSRDAELLQSEIAAFAGNGASDEEIEEILFDRERHSNQDRFYPLIGAMFRILGFDCRVSRQGDNGSRMDAIIVGPGDAIPIEIKSPGEEELISVKGIKQAAENKIIMLSRQDYQTSADTVSLVVGYKAPNERAEVASLIEAFRSVFGINIGVISFDVLVGLVVECVTKQKTISVKQLQTLKGFANVAE